MYTTDPIADFLTRIRNAQQAGHRIVEMPASKMKKRLTEILYEQGFIHKYKFADDEGMSGTVKIALKYLPETGTPLIRKLIRVSKPGLRQYKGTGEIPRVLNGLGISIVSTSKGVMTGKQAQKNNVGGEVLCYIY